MKKTTKKLSINKETVASFTVLSEKEKAEAKGGAMSKGLGDLLTDMSWCLNCATIWGCDEYYER